MKYHLSLFDRFARGKWLLTQENVETSDYFSSPLRLIWAPPSSKLIWKTIILPYLWTYMVSVSRLQSLSGEFY